MLNDKFSKRFEELHKKSNSIEPDVNRLGHEYFPRSIWYSWAIDCENLLKAVFGEHSTYYTGFVESMKLSYTDEEQLRLLQSIFNSAKVAFDGDYIFDVERSISGEILGDFILLAKQALSDGHKDVAAVLASAALEDALKRYAKRNGLKVEDAVMSKVISALKSKRLVSGARTSMLDVMPKLRNHALHAEWDKITEPDVNSIIGFVEQFLLTEFSP